MTRLATLTLVLCLFVPSLAFAAIDGAWTAALDDKRSGGIDFSLTREQVHWDGNAMRLADFSGLSEAQTRAATATPVRFELRREAGTIAFEGSFRNGRGAGHFDFTPDRGYIAALRSLGVEPRLEHARRQRSEDEDLFTLALHDVSTSFIRSMIAEGYKVPLEKYLAMRIFDVTPEYVREMRALGFSSLGAKDLIDSRIHRVTPEYVRPMRAAGRSPSFEDLKAGSIHGATPQFAAEMKRLGYGDLSLDQLVSFRIHRVTPTFITELRNLGYDRLSANDLVSMRIHRVTPELIRELEAAGYSRVPVDKLVAMRIHGIEPRLVRAMSR
jgi:hypothetical protein